MKKNFLLLVYFISYILILILLLLSTHPVVAGSTYQPPQMPRNTNKTNQKQNPLKIVLDSESKLNFTTKSSRSIPASHYYRSFVLVLYLSLNHPSLRPPVCELLKEGLEVSIRVNICSRHASIAATNIEFACQLIIVLKSLI